VIINRLKERERAYFLNYAFKIMWKKRLKDCIENKVAFYLKKKLEDKKFYLTSLNLGSVPPIIIDVDVENSNCFKCAKRMCDRTKCQDFSYSLLVNIYFESENSEICISHEFKKVKTGITLKKLKFSALLQVRVYDLVNIIPGFSKYSISFLNPPKFDYHINLTGSGLSYGFIPLVSGKINKILKRELWERVIYPETNVTEMNKEMTFQKRVSKELILNGKPFNQSESKLIVKVKGLELVSLIKWPSKSKPMFVAVENRDLFLQNKNYLEWFFVIGLRNGGRLYHSQYKEISFGLSSIEWNEEFIFYDFELDNGSFKGNFLSVDVYIVGKDMNHLMGQCVIDLEEHLQINFPCDRKKIREPVIDVSLLFIPLLFSL